MKALYTVKMRSPSCISDVLVEIYDVYERNYKISVVIQQAIQRIVAGSIHNTLERCMHGIMTKVEESMYINVLYTVYASLGKLLMLWIHRRDWYNGSCWRALSLRERANVISR